MDQEALLQPDDPEEEQFFGQDVAIEGHLLAVSAVRDNDLALQAGSIYLFSRAPDGSWPQQAKLTAFDQDHYDAFGETIDLSRGQLAVGSPADDEAGNSSGSVYVRALSPKGWTRPQKLAAQDAQQNDQFGREVVLDGNTRVIGALNPNGLASYGGAAPGSQAPWSSCAAPVSGSPRPSAMR